MTAPLYCHRFGSAEFDAGRLQLRVDGVAVDLQVKPLELLALLLATPGELVSRRRIFDTLWKDRQVVEAVLDNAASKLRAALGRRHAGFVVTVPRKGYRFEGSVERVAVGRQMASVLALAAGMPVPGRAGHLLLRPLGASPRNETWLAEQPKTGDRRVFKFALDGERLADLKREWTLARVLHSTLGERPDLMRVLDSNFETAPFWLETAYGGESLDAWAGGAQGPGTRLQALPRRARLQMALQMADALAAAHGAGVLHKDLKPGNVLVAPAAPGGGEHDAPWQVRLADFGSGRLLDAAQLERLRVTRLGLTLDSDDSSSGTPYYIAPELLSGGRSGPAGDVYALGVMLYQLLAGDLRRPLAPGWERDIDDDLLREDIAAATDIDPARRLSSAAELATRLRQLEPRRQQRQAENTRGELERQRLATQALQRRNEIATALNRLLCEDLIGAANPAAQGRADITVAEALTGAAERIEARYGALPAEVRGSLHASMQTVLGELSRSQDAVQAGRRAVAALAQAWDEAQAGPAAPEPALLETLQSARLRLALDLVQLSQLQEAGQVVAAIEAAPAVPGALFQARLLYVKSWLTGGELALQASLGQLEQAWALVHDLDELRAPGRDKIMFALADSLAMLGRHEEGEALYRQLHAEQCQRLGAGHARAAYTLVGLGNVLTRQGRHGEARSLLQQAAERLGATLGAAHRQTLTALDMLADLDFKQGDFAAAASAWARVREGYAALLGEGSSYVLTVQTQLALAQHRLGQPAAALTLLKDAQAKAAAFLDERAPQMQQIRFALAEALADTGQPAQAQALLAGLDAASLDLAQPASDWPQRLCALQARVRAEPVAGSG